ncbi:putative BZIP domain-containing protein [Seiridium cardinale]|uniref:BZIP domain-containing protein n=1 Tax=Seiridium cardinale TaxID=138064 RepID=A0ABR2XSK9_9PEZI
MASSESGQLTASERKRERDRLNQQTKRRREREHIATLEERVRCLEQELQFATSHPNTPLGITVRRQAPHHPIVRQDAGGDVESQPSSTPVVDADLSPAGSMSSTPSFESGTLQAVSTIESTPDLSTATITIAVDHLNSLLNSPAWLRLPLLTHSPLPGPQLLLRSEMFGSVIERLRSTPNVAASLPATPKVLDLLFGGSQNELANLIVSFLTPYPSLAPERFAMSWLIYLYYRWYVAPTEELYAAIPAHMRPTTCQLCLGHPAWLASIIWPCVRERLVLHYSEYNLEELFGLLSCTMRVRASFNGRFINRENDGEPQVDERFLERITQKSGWGILDKFWNEYPDLFQGVEPDILLREEHLLSA